MTLGSVINQLKYGELRSVAVKDDTEAIVSYINLALIALYGRFSLKTSEQIIPMYNNIVEYTLNDDLMLIDAIYDENGDEFSLDDTSSYFSIMQVDFETIQVPNPSTGVTLSVIYRPSPVELTYVDETSLTTKIPIPPQLLEPLLHYVGYRVHGSINGNVDGENNTHLMRYEASVRRIKDLGLIREAVVPAHVSLKEQVSATDEEYQEVNEG